jgi:hypothetical protein
MVVSMFGITAMIWYTWPRRSSQGKWCCDIETYETMSFLRNGEKKYLMNVGA